MKPLHAFSLALACAASQCLSAGQLKIACIGDSITEGDFLNNPVQESYPGKLGQLLGTNYLVHNFGVSGRTLLKKGDFPYWKETAYTQSLAWNPDIVTIMLGTNDAKPQNWRYATNFIPDYSALVASYTSLASHPRILLFTPCPGFANGGYDINPGVVATNVLPAVREVAQTLGLELIDVNTPMAGHPEWFPDHIHPNSKGTSVIAAVDYTALLGDSTGGALPDLESYLYPASRIILAWPSSWAGWVVQSAPAPNAAAPAWTILETIATNSGGSLHSGTGVAGSAKFFRLWKPGT